jgi:uncharacterized protein YukE
MGAIQDHMALTDQEKLDQQVQATSDHSGFHQDGSGKINDYHPPRLPQSNWPPGLKADGQFSVHRDALTQVAGHMGADLTELQNTLSALNGGGAGGASLAGWATADGMGNNAGQAYYGISTFYQALNDVYDQVIGYLHQTVTNYADAETTTATAANNVGTDVAPGGLSAA